jgi:hypothetical protein
MRRAAAVLLAAMAGISAAQPQERVFRRDVEAIHIDARALDRDGRFDHRQVTPEKQPRRAPRTPRNVSLCDPGELRGDLPALF